MEKDVLFVLCQGETLDRFLFGVVKRVKSVKKCIDNITDPPQGGYTEAIKKKEVYYSSSFLPY